MRILVDADACPVKDEIILLAKKNTLDVHFFADINHDLNRYNATIHIIDQGRDAVDFALIGAMENGDIVVTADYGVASLALGKNGHVLHPSGKIIDLHNIDLLMFERHLGKKARQAGHRGPRHKKRRADDNLHFYHQLEKLIQHLQ